MATKPFTTKPDFLTFSTNSERDAYFLGLFYADGYNSQKQGRLVIRLQPGDRAFLQTISNTIFNEPRELYTVRGYPELNVGSKRLSLKMAELGAPQAKTFKIRFPNFLSVQDCRHFIRGYFDGDGSCMEMKRKNAQLQRAVSFCGTLDFVSSLLTVIRDHTGIEMKIIPTGNIYLLYAGGNRRSLSILEWMYSDCSFFLPRKKSRFDDLKRDVHELDSRRCHVSFCKQKGKWMGRLPLKFGRKFTGYSDTKEGAIKKFNDALKGKL